MGVYFTQNEDCWGSYGAPLPFRGNNSTYPGPKPTKNDDGNIMGSLGFVRSTSTPIRIRVWDFIYLVELIDHPHAHSISCDYGK